MQDPPTTLRIIQELAAGWLSIPAIIGSHMRAASYFLNCGTEAQKEHYLPLLAKGKLIASHAYNELAVHDSKVLGTTLRHDSGNWILNGSKHWVTNALDSDFIIIIARLVDKESSHRLVAVLLKRERYDELQMIDLVRPGIKGVSLCEVTCNQIKIDPDRETIGGITVDVTPVLKLASAAKYLNFAARSLGCAQAIVSHCAKLLKLRNASSLHPVALHRFGEMQSKLYACESMFERALQNYSSDQQDEIAAMSAKVFCGQELQNIIRHAINLLGGAGYASQDSFLERCYRDAASLQVSGTTLDVVCTKLAANYLENYHV